MKTLAALLALAAAASAEPAIKIEAVKEKGWAKLVATSENYEIRSDCDAKTLQQIVTMLEDLHRAFVQTFKQEGKKDEARDKMQVSFYKTRKAFLADMQMPGGGGPMGPGAPPAGKGGPGGPGGPGGDGGPGGYYDPGAKTLHASLEVTAGDDWQFVLRHEGTHQLLHIRAGIGGGQPGVTSAIWFNEGFASYWAMTVWKGKDVVEGGVMKKLFDEVKQMISSKTLVPLKTLVGGQPNPMAMKAYYSEGWALCHFLRNSKYKEKFAAYMDKERAGKISWDDFAAAIGIEDADAFEKEFVAHVAALK